MAHFESRRWKLSGADQLWPKRVRVAGVDCDGVRSKKGAGGNGVRKCCLDTRYASYKVGMDNSTIYIYPFISTYISKHLKIIKDMLDVRYTDTVHRHPWYHLQSAIGSSPFTAPMAGVGLSDAFAASQWTPRTWHETLGLWDHQWLVLWNMTFILLVLNREWMGCWWLLRWLLIISQWITPENSLLFLWLSIFIDGLPIINMVLSQYGDFP